MFKFLLFIIVLWVFFLNKRFYQNVKYELVA